MGKERFSSRLTFLVVGDSLTLLLVTIFGFASHGTLETAGWRMMTTFLPLWIAWIGVAPFFFVYDLERITSARELWRPVYAMFIAAPLAAGLRGLWLGSPIFPIFILILGGVAALGMLLWRGLHYVWAARNP